MSPLRKALDELDTPLEEFRPQAYLCIGNIPRPGGVYKVIGVNRYGDHGVEAETRKAHQWLRLKKPLYVRKRGDRFTV